MSGPIASTYAYRPALDGLRAAAVIAVMAYHARYGWAAGGFLGVDVFFVLSGFLITSIVTEERAATGRIALGTFWRRRLRRLVPALLLVLLGVAAYARWAASSIQLDRIRDDGLATLVFVNNWNYVANGVSYFEQFGIFSSPLRHTWSLGIEMQFYLVWPLVLAVVPRRSVFAIAAGGAVASAIAMAVLFDPHVDPSRVYFGTDTHVQSLLVGAALAASPARRSSGRFALAGCGVLAGMVVFASDASPWMYRGGFLIAALAAATVVAAASQTAGAVAAALAWRPLVALGRVSYGVYLWHWPVYLALDETSVRGPVLQALRFALSFALAGASYVLIERPVLHANLRFRPRFVLPATATAAVAAALVVSTAGAPALSPRALVAAERSPLPTGKLRAEEPDDVRVFFVGDSSMFTLQYFGNWPERAGGTVSAWAPIGCPVLRAQRVFDRELPAECSQWPDEIASQVASTDPDLVVLQLGIWDLGDRVVGGSSLDVSDDGFAAYFDRELGLAYDLATARGGRLALLDVPCSKDVDDAEVAALNANIARFRAAHPDVGVVRWGDFLCLQPELRPDGVHFDDETAPIVSRWLAPRVFAEARQGRNARTTTPAS